MPCTVLYVCRFKYVSQESGSGANADEFESLTNEHGGELADELAEELAATPDGSAADDAEDDDVAAWYDGTTSRGCGTWWKAARTPSASGVLRCTGASAAVCA